MILTGNEIEKEAIAEKIKISPFDATRISTNSYDLCLGEMLIKYTDETIDPRQPVGYTSLRIPPAGLLMQPGDFLLGHSIETIGSDFYVPIIHARSGIARLGLFVHVTADLIDLGSHGQVTFQLMATLPVRIYPGMKIGQVSFWVPKGDISLYLGKYQGSKGPRPSEIYKDFEPHCFEKSGNDQ